MSQADASNGRQGTSIASAAPADAAPSFDVQGFINSRIAEHRHILGQRLVTLRALAGQTSSANANVPDLAAMDQKIALLCNDLRDCFSREESMVFPSMLRLRTQLSVSRCQAGMVRARLRFMVAEQDSLIAKLAEACDVARKYLSPEGPCEFCRDLLTVMEELAAELSEHVRREQDDLFAWALAREEWLTRQMASDADERCL